MRFEELGAMEKKKRRNVLVGIRIDSHSRELLSWALVKVAEPGDCVVAVHVCRSCDNASRNKPLLDDYLEVYQGLCSVKKVELTGQILTGSSVRKVLAKEAKNYDAVALVLGINKQSTIGSSVSTAKYCAKRLPLTTDVMAIHNGRVVFRRCTSNHLPGLEGDPRPSVNTRRCQSEFGDSDFETETVFSFCETTPKLGSDDLKSDCFSFIHEESGAISRSNSLLSENSIDQKLGWPLLKKANSGISQSPKTRRNVSVVQWVMSLPDRSPIHSTKFSTILETPLEMEINDIVDDNFKFRLSAFSEIPEGLENLLQNNSSSCKWFSLDVLKSYTSEFSSENLIGNGGCNRVYKGTLPDGKPVAVKILNSSKQAWKDFALEFDIISTLKHKHITPLIGICIEENALISVYDLLPSGSLEENLHGKNNNKEKGVLSWEVRYSVAIGIAEALNYLHKECPRPVIHRDVKSSNILLADGFDPKLSDFGLAIWGPTTSSFLTEGDVVGTFGYLAPEYFMFGKVSDKIDVYAFGVVLLELLSGRRPIGCDDTSKEQESLVMWAKPMLESGDVKGLLDPDLDGKVDEVQMQRMLVAASLCLTRSARLRPTTSQILKLLKEDQGVEKCVKFQNNCENDIENHEENDDEVYPSSNAELHLNLALLDVLDDDTTSFTSTDPSNSISLEEYLKGRWSRSSSFDN